MRTAMDNACWKAGLATALRTRVCDALGQRLDNCKILQMAIACSFRDPEDLLGMLFPAHLAKQVMLKKNTVALRPDEWAAFFGSASGSVRNEGLSAIVRSADFQTHVSALSAALRTTVAEQQQARMWARSWCQAACHVGLHFEDPQQAIGNIVGQIVKADFRRLDDLQARIDDRGYETILLCKLVTALVAEIT